MQQLIAKAHICLIPHIKSDHTDTTIPHKIFQYMYADKPIVASDCAPIKRIVEASKCGLIYRWNQPQEFAACIKEIESNPTQLEAMIANGKKNVLSDYLWETDSKRLNSIYQ